MSSFIYAGHDFSRYVTAELVEPAAHAVGPDAVAVPGRPGALLLGGAVAPLELRLRVFLDCAALDAAARSRARMAMRAWLLAPGGGTLSVPGEPGLEWRDAVLVSVSSWGSLFAEGSAELAFRALDPIAWGREASSSGATLEVGGTWRTWPRVGMTAETGAESVSVELEASGRKVAVAAPEKAFSGGEEVVLDFEAESCEVDGKRRDDLVDVESSFFALGPGTAALAFSGCEAHAVTWRERWA